MNVVSGSDNHGSSPNHIFGTRGQPLIVSKDADKGFIVDIPLTVYGLYAALTFAVNSFLSLRFILILCFWLILYVALRGFCHDIVHICTSYEKRLKSLVHLFIRPFNNIKRKAMYVVDYSRGKNYSLNT